MGARRDPGQVHVPGGFPGRLAQGQGSNYHFETFKMGGSQSERAERNLRALRILKTVEQAGRLPSEEEKAALTAYAGWGGLPQIFEDSLPEDSAPARQQAELKSLLTEDEYRAAKASTLDAFYTPPEVISAIYTGLARVGAVPEDNKELKALEPSAGIGHFIGAKPSLLHYRFTAVELDRVSARIMRILYPQEEIFNGGYENISTRDLGGKNFDVVLGNPPFGNDSLFDREYSPDLGKASIHSFFIAKSIDQLHEGGIGAFVVSRYFLDSSAPAAQRAREYVAERADLLGAVRLPNDTFSKNAGTAAVTDIVFFRRHNGRNRLSTEWLKLDERRFERDSDKKYFVNHYFTLHPDMVLGEEMLVNGRFGPELTYQRPLEGYQYHIRGEDHVEGWLNGRIEQCLDQLPENVFTPAQKNEQEQKPAFPPQDPQVLESKYYQQLKPGQFFKLPDGGLAFKSYDKYRFTDQRGGEWENVCPYSLTEFTGRDAARKMQRAAGMIEVRDCLRELMNAEKEDQPQETLDHLRLKLNQTYDRFTEQHGYLSAAVNKDLLHEDQELPLLTSLEVNFDPGVSVKQAKKLGTVPRGPSAQKADIFRERVLRPYKPITEAEDPKQALAASIQSCGRINLDYMTELLAHKGYTAEQVAGELLRDDQIFFDPERQEYQLAASYLSGDVRHKLKEAEAAVKNDPALQHNVLKLKEVLPPDLEAADIAVSLDSPWIPDRVYSAFVRYLTNDRINFGGEFTQFDETLGKRLFSLDLSKDTFTWGQLDRFCRHFTGTDHVKVSDILRSAVTNKPIRVTHDDYDKEGRKIKIVDYEATKEAQFKVEELNDLFADWIWQDEQRRHELTALYNERYNCYVAPKYDGSGLQLTQASDQIKLRPHQKDAVMRGLIQGGGLIDHVVGAGKTMVAVATVMEQKRKGLVQKPMIVVPNHLLKQWQQDFYQVYPDAKILVGEPDDFTAENKKSFFSKAATGNWDAIIVAHSSFDNIKAPLAFEQKLINEQLELLDRKIAYYKANYNAGKSVKEQQQMLRRLGTELKRLSKAAGTAVNSVDFSDLGVDCLVVDEAHLYKNLKFITGMNIKGMGNPNGSAKAWDMYMKVRWLQEQREDKGVYFLTGTPISNSLSELFTMQRYLQGDELKAKHLDFYDEWLATFGKISVQHELDATGVNYESVLRLTGIKAPQELLSMYRSFADVVTQQDLNDQAKSLGLRPYVPSVKSGRPVNVIAEPSPQQTEYMMRIVDRMEEVRAGSVDPRDDNALKITQEAAMCGLDFRNIDPAAPDFADSKVNLCVNQLFEIYERTKEERGTQLVFCDRSMPDKTRQTERRKREESQAKAQRRKAADALVSQSANGAESLEQSAGGTDAEDQAAAKRLENEALNAGFSVYDDVKAKLIAKGVPAEEIAFIHDADTPEKKQDLFNKVNQGQVRILIGSTAKMGAGMNVQRRLVAAHHLDCPWRPSDLEQRNGRIIRQGNLFYQEDPSFQVEIYNYSTKRTYDARLWQVIENKARTIDDFRRGQISDMRFIENVDSVETATAAEMKAAATGNPLILMEVQLHDDLKRLQSRQKAYMRSLHRAQDELKQLRSRDFTAERAKLERGRQEVAAAMTAQTKYDQDGRIQPQLFLSDGRVLNTATKENTALFQNHLLQTVKLCIDDLDNVLTHYVEGFAPEHSVGHYRGFELVVQGFYQKEKQGVYMMLRDKEHQLYFMPDNFFYSIKDLQHGLPVNGTLTRLNNFLSDKVEAAFNMRSDELNYQEQRIAQLEEEAAKPFKQELHLKIAERNYAEVLSELNHSREDPSYESKWKPEPLPDDDADLGPYVQSLQESAENSLQQPLEQKHESVQTTAAEQPESSQTDDQAPVLEVQYIEPQAQDGADAQAQMRLSDAARPITDTLAEVDLGQLVSGLRQRAGLDPVPPAQQTGAAEEQTDTAVQASAAESSAEQEAESAEQRQGTADAPSAEAAMLQAAVESDHLSFAHVTADSFMGRKRQRPAADGANFAAAKPQETPAEEQPQSAGRETVGQAQAETTADSREHVRYANIKKLAALLHVEDYALTTALDPDNINYHESSARLCFNVRSEETAALFKQSSDFKNYMSAVKLVEAFRAQDCMLDIEKIDPQQFAAQAYYQASDLGEDELRHLLGSAERQYRDVHNVSRDNYDLTYAHVPHVMLNYKGRMRGRNDDFTAVLIKESTAREVAALTAQDVIWDSEQEAFKALLKHQYASGAVIKDEEYQMLLNSGLSEHKSVFSQELSNYAAALFIAENSAVHTLKPLTAFINSQNRQSYDWQNERAQTAEFMHKFGGAEVKSEAAPEIASAEQEQSTAAPPEREPSAVKQDDHVQLAGGLQTVHRAFADVQLHASERADFVTSIFSPAGGLLQLENLELQTAGGSEQPDRAAYVTRRQMLHELEKFSDFKAKQPQLTSNEIEVLLIGMMDKINESSSVPVAMLPDGEKEQFDLGRRTVNDYKQYLGNAGLERLARLQERYEQSHAVFRSAENSSAHTVAAGLKLVLDAAGSRVDQQQAEDLLSALRADLLDRVGLKQSAQVNSPEDFKFTVRTAAEKFLTDHYDQYGSAAFELLENASLLNQVTDSFKLYDQLHEVQPAAQVQEPQAESRSEPAKVQLENLNVKVPQYAELKFVYKAQDGSFKQEELRYFSSEQVESFMDAFGVIYPAAARQQFTEACNQAGWQVLVGTARGLSTFARDQVRSVENLTSLISQLKGTSYQEASYQALRAEEAAPVMAAVGDSVTVPRSLTAPDLKLLCTNLGLSAEHSELLAKQGRSAQEQAGLDRMANAARFADIFFSTNKSYRARQIISLAEKQYSSGYELRQTEIFKDLSKELTSAADQDLPVNYQNFLQKYHNKTFGLKVLLSLFIESGCRMDFAAEAVPVSEHEKAEVQQESSAQAQEQKGSAEHESAASQPAEQEKTAQAEEAVKDSEAQSTAQAEEPQAVPTEAAVQETSAAESAAAVEPPAVAQPKQKQGAEILERFIAAYAKPQDKLYALLNAQAVQCSSVEEFVHSGAVKPLVTEIGRLVGTAEHGGRNAETEAVRRIFTSGGEAVKEALEGFKRAYFAEFLEKMKAKGVTPKAMETENLVQSLERQYSKPAVDQGRRVLADAVDLCRRIGLPTEGLTESEKRQSIAAAVNVFGMMGAPQGSSFYKKLTSANHTEERGRYALIAAQLWQAQDAAEPVSKQDRVPVQALLREVLLSPQIFKDLAQAAAGGHVNLDRAFNAAVYLKEQSCEANHSTAPDSKAFAALQSDQELRQSVFAETAVKLHQLRAEAQAGALIPLSERQSTQSRAESAVKPQVQSAAEPEASERSMYFVCFTRDPQVTKALSGFKYDEQAQAYAVSKRELASLKAEWFDCGQGALYENLNLLHNGIYMPNSLAKALCAGRELPEQRNFTFEQVFGMSDQQEQHPQVREVRASTLRDGCAYINPGKFPQLMNFVDGVRKIKNTVIYEVPLRNLAQADPRVRQMSTFLNLTDAVVGRNELTKEQLQVFLPKEDQQADVNKEHKVKRSA